MDRSINSTFYTQEELCYRFTPFIKHFGRVQMAFCHITDEKSRRHIQNLFVENYCATSRRSGTKANGPAYLSSAWRSGPGTAVLGARCVFPKIWR